MGDLFTKVRLDKVVKEMARHSYPARINGTFQWAIDQGKAGLTFTKPDDQLSVTLAELTPLGAEGVALGYRESHYKAAVRVDLTASKTLPDWDTRKKELVRKAVRNERTVSLGQAISREAVLAHLDTHIAGFVQDLLRDLDKTLATLFWDADKPAPIARSL